MIDLVTPQNALLANQSAAALATNLVVASLNAPANFLKVGQVWGFFAPFTFLHTAAATPTLTLELSVAGAAIVAAVATPVSTAATFHGLLQGFLTVRAVGASGSLCGAVFIRAQGLTLANAACDVAQVDTTPDTVDLTTAKLIELRARMTTAVASNTLTVPQGWVQRLAG